MADEITRTILIRGRAELGPMEQQLGRVEQNVQSKFRGIETAGRNVSGALRPLAAEMTNMAGASRNLGNALQNLLLVGFSPVGLAVTGILVTVGALMRAWNQSKQATEEFTRNLAEHGKALAELNLEYQTLTGQVSELDAQLIRFRRNQAAGQLDPLREQVSRMRSIIGALPGGGDRISQFMRGLIGLSDEDLRQAENRLAALEALFHAQETASARNTRTRQGVDVARRDAAAVKQLIDAMKADLARLDQQRVDVTLGPEGGLISGLDRDLTALREKLGGRLIPAKDLAQIDELRQKIIGSEKAIRDLDQAMKAFGGFDAMDAEQGARAFEEMEKAAGRTATELRREVEELQKLMGFEALPPEQQGQARINEELKERLRLIDEWVKAEEAAGRDVTLIAQQAAAAVAQAYEAARQKSIDSVDELTEFQKRSFQRMQDAISDITNDALSGQIRSWEDLGMRVKRVIDQIVSEFLAMQLKLALFGPNFGSAGGGLGGLLGLLFGGGSSAPTSAIGGAFDIDALLWHKGGRVGDATERRRVSALAFAAAPRLHGGGVAGIRPNEVPAILERGERVLTGRQWSAVTSSLRQADAGGGTTNYGPFVFNGVDNFDSFKRSRANLMADLVRTVERARKHT